MWYGKDTEELKKLNNEYREMFGRYPFGHMELEYGALNSHQIGKEEFKNHQSEMMRWYFYTHFSRCATTAEKRGGQS